MEVVRMRPGVEGCVSNIVPELVQDARWGNEMGKDGVGPRLISRQTYPNSQAASTPASSSTTPSSAT